MSGTNTYVLDNTSADGQTIDSAVAIDLSNRTTPITLFLIGSDPGLVTTIVGGPGLATIDASADDNQIALTDGKGSLVFEAGSGATELNNLDKAVVLGGSGTLAIRAQGSVALLPGTGLATVTNNLAQVRVFSETARDGFVAATALAHNPATLTAYYDSLTVGGVKIAATAQDGSTATFTIPSTSGNMYVENDGDLKNSPTLTAPAQIVPAPTVAAYLDGASDATSGEYVLTITAAANAGQGGSYIVSVDGTAVATVAPTSTGTLQASVALALDPTQTHTVTYEAFQPGGYAFAPSGSTTIDPTKILALTSDPGATVATAFQVQGTAPAGVTVSIFAGTTLLITTPADDTDAWQVDVPAATAALVAGQTYAITARWTDPSSHLLVTSLPAPFTVPNPPSSLQLHEDADGNWTLTGSTDQVGDVTVTVDDAVVASVTPTGGQFTVALSTPLATGSNTVVVDQATLYGTSEVTLTPVVPNQPTLIADSAADGMIALHGTADPGAVVTIHDSAAADQTVHADATTGDWTVNVAWTTDPVNAVTVSASVADPYLATGVLDSVPTTLEVSPAITAATPSGSPATDVVFAGTAAPGSTVSIVVDGTIAAPVTEIADPATGAWTLDDVGALNAGPHSAVATITDDNGNLVSSLAYDFAVASQTPAIDATPTASTKADTLYTLTGEADPNATITVSIDGVAQTATTVADESGQWSYDVRDPGGPFTGPVAHAFTVSAPDANHPSTALFSGITITVAPPSLNPVTFPTATTMLVSGTAYSGAMVTVTVNGIPQIAQVNSDGTFSAIAAVPSGGGAIIVTASAPDQYGTVTLVSTPETLTFPSTPVITSAVADATGAIVVGGTADPGALVTVLVNGAPDGTAATADVAGHWLHTVATPAAVATVGASVATSGFPLLSGGTVAPGYDAVAPTASLRAGAPAADYFALQGTAAPNATLAISVGGVTLGTTTANAAGSWIYDQTEAITAGPHSVAVSVVGQTSGAASTPLTVASRTPVITGDAAHPSGAASTVVSLQGTADAGATVAISVAGGAPLATTTADAAGRWSADLAGPLSGTESFTASAPDANTGAVLTSAGFVATLPVAPTIGYADKTSAGGVTTVTVFGTAAAGTAVTVAPKLGSWSAAAVTADDGGRSGFTVALLDAAAAALDLSGFTASVADPLTPSGVLSATAAAGTGPAPAPALITRVGPANPPAANTIMVAGTASPGAIVTLTIAGAAAPAIGGAPIQADQDGNFTATIATPAAGSDYQVAANVAGATPVAGSVASLHVALTPVLTGTDTSHAPPGTALELRGAADPNATVTIAIDGGAAKSVTAGADGTWVDDETSILPGSHTIVLSASDPGTATTLTTSRTLILNAPLIVAAASDAAHFVTVNGTALPGSAVTLASDALAQPITVTANSLGLWQYGFTGAPGTHGITASAVDPTLGVAEISAPRSFAVSAGAAAVSTDPLQLALLAAQAIVPPGISIGLASIPAAGAVVSSVIAPGASGAVTVAAGTQLTLNQASAPVVLTGNGGANQIVANGGGQITYITKGGSGVFLDGASHTNDSFTAPQTGGGSFVVQLGSGDNQVVAGSGDVTVLGGAGANHIVTGNGHAVVSLAGRDTVVAGAGTASVHATGSANELVFGGSGNLVFDNNSGVATVAGSSGSATIHAWGGTGVFWGGSAGNNELSANHDCTLVGGGNNDHLIAWGGHNELWAVHGNATLQAIGQGDHNLLVGGDGDDWISANATGDTILGGLGNSTLWGGAGDELIHLSQKNSIVYAGSGNETLIAGAGVDEMVFFRRAGARTVEVQGFSHGLDHVNFADHTAADVTQALQGQVQSAAGVTLSLSDGTKIVFAGLDKVGATDIG